MSLKARIRRFLLIFAAFLAVAMGGATLPTEPSSAATACPSSRPTWLGGTFRGSDGRAINAVIGVVLKDKNGVNVLEDGSRDPDGAYGFAQRFNDGVPATGTTDPGAVRTWGRCVAANVALSFIEIYPQRPTPITTTSTTTTTTTTTTTPTTTTTAAAGGLRSGRAEYGRYDLGPLGQTDYSRYGLGSYYFLRVTAGQRLNVLLRTPLIYQLGGNTGGVQGYITHNGRPVPPASIAPVRAFTRQPGSACGIEGMGVIANKLITGPKSGRTYYLIDFLAAGQCGAPYQVYSLRMTCNPPACGSAPKLVIKRIQIMRGRWPRVDVAF